MRIDLERAARAQHDTLRQLMQLYVYDFSELLNLEVNEDGRFVDRPLGPYWEDPTRYPNFIRVDDRLAGFALVRRGSKLSDDAEVWDMEEFFVLRHYRRSGVGMEAARQVFMANPGKWEVRQRRENTSAIAFWRSAIGAYTGQRFVEDILDNEHWQGCVQRFTS